jgi:formate hydrogenlyase subunit 3/multisubunit Na+/H+ antiporter MnhD subunit
LPLTFLGLAIGGFGLLGLPFTPGFPGHWIVLRELLAQHSAWVWLLLLATGLGTIGYGRAFVAAFREAPPERIAAIEQEPRLATALILGLSVVAVGFALFPQRLKPAVDYILASLSLIRL